MRIALAIICMYIAVGTAPDYPMLKTLLWGISWTGAAAIIAWPLFERGKSNKSVCICSRAGAMRMPGSPRRIKERT